MNLSDWWAVALGNNFNLGAMFLLTGCTSLGLGLYENACFVPAFSAINLHSVGIGYLAQLSSLLQAIWVVLEDEGHTINV